MYRSVVVDHLRRSYRKPNEVGVACIYCQHKDREVQNPRNLLASLWRQLYDTDTSLPDDVQELYKRRIKSNTEATLDEVVAMLKTQIWRHSVVHLLIDALDECPEDGKVRMTVIQRLQGILAATKPDTVKVRLLVTSRSDASPFEGSK